MFEVKFRGWRGFYIGMITDKLDLLWWRDLNKVYGDDDYSKWLRRRVSWKVGNYRNISF